jgi:predicted dehydrogenase
MPETLGLAIVGCGQIVTHHLAAMASLVTQTATGEAASIAAADDHNSTPVIELRALCDPSAERRQVIAELPASQCLIGPQPPKQYTSMDDLLNDASMFADCIDIVFIAVPHDLHETLALHALAAASNGSSTNSRPKLVVMEKPLAPTRDSCDKRVAKSLELSKSSSSLLPMLVIAEQSPYWQEVQLAKQLIQDNAIGTIVTAASYYYESMRTNDTSGNVDESGGLGWRGSLARAGGGT